MRTIFALSLFLFSLTQVHSAPLPVPAAPKIAAKSYILLDPNSGHTIAEKNSTTRVEPASITKLLTAYVLFTELANGTASLEDEVTISTRAWRSTGSRMFIEERSRVKLEDLLKGMIIQSGNDASVALAEYVAGSEEAFADLMNHHAKRLGLTNSNFVNSTGMPNRNHYSTVQDIAKIAKALLVEFPDYYPWYAVKKFTYNGIEQYNRNRLLWRDPRVDGMKTGHTDSAGYCLVSSAKQGEMRLIAIVMGTKSEEARAQQSQRLLNYGFRYYETHRLYNAGEELTHARIWKGADEQLPLGLRQDLFVTIPRGQYKNLNASMDLLENILAPATKGSRYGTLSIKLEESMVAEQPLIAIRDIGTGSIMQRMMDEVKMWFR